MNNCSESVNKNHDIIDVVEDFNYDTQTEKYNKAYKKWRNSKDNPYTFNYVKHKKEKTFIDGKGFIYDKPESAEKNTITKISFTLGISLIIYFFIDGMGSELIVWFLNFLNINISMTLISSEFMGNVWIVLTINVFISIIKYIIPIFMLIKAFKLPYAVVAPVKITDKYELTGGLSIAVITMVIISIISRTSPILFTSRTFFLSNQILYEDYNINAAIIYYMFEIIIVSVLTEFFLHGVILHTLRQFGDIFSVFATSIISMIIIHDFQQCVPFALLTLITGVFVLRSGSIITGCIIRAIFNFYFFSIMLINSSINQNNDLIKAYFISIIFLIGVLSCVLFVQKRTKSIKLVNNYTFLSQREKASTFALTPTMITWVALSGVFAALKYFL